MKMNHKVSGALLITRERSYLCVCGLFPVLTLFASGIMQCKYLAKNWLLKFLCILFQEPCFQEEGHGKLSIYSSNLLIFAPSGFTI